MANQPDGNRYNRQRQDSQRYNSTASFQYTVYQRTIKSAGTR